MKILVTGGAGFVGSHIVDALIERGHSVRVYDDLTPQVHTQHDIPEYLNKEAEFVAGDIRDRDRLAKAMDEVEVIFHEASAVGVGQSMYQIREYIDVNALGTAVLLDILANDSHKIQKLIMAASMSEYGEGEYRCEDCGTVYPTHRETQQLQERQWEMLCPKCSKIVEPVPTSENKPLNPTSIYAISKQIQEQMCLCTGQTFNIPTVALRYFNIYGTRQSLSNPYTGVMAIFSSRILNDNPPMVFEDGLQSRDFVHVSDIVQANILAMENDRADGQIFNVGTGIPTTILGVAEKLISAMGSDLKPQIANKFRAGDIRHCVADISKIRDALGYEPKMALENGIRELVEWSAKQEAVDKFEMASQELKAKGMVKE